MRPSSITRPGALLRHRLGPASVDQGSDAPPSPDCCDTDESNIPDRAADRIPFSLGEATGDTEDLNLGATVTDGGGNKTWSNPSRVNDDDPDTFAVIDAFAGGGGTYDGDLESDLGAEAAVFGFTVDADTDCSGTHVGKWLFAHSDDGISWTDAPASLVSEVPETVGITRMISEWSLDDAPISARYWRLRWHRGPVGGFSCGSAIHTWAINGSSVVTTGWIVLEPLTVDGDDATYEDVDGAATSGDHLRFDLGAAYRIVRTRMRLGTTTAGAKTITLTGWNELDESDATVVATIPFTGVGTLTAQDVTSSWFTTDAFRYWQVDGPAEIVRWFSVEFYEPTASQSHQHDSVAEEAVRDAGRWELAVITGSPPDPLYADGDYLYIWVSGA